MNQEEIIARIKKTEFGKSVKIFNNLVIFRLPKVHFREAQSYALIQEDGLILIDAVHKETKKAVEELMDEHPVKAMIITHSDVLHQAFGRSDEMKQWLKGAPLFVHPADVGREHYPSILESSHVLNLSGLLVTPIPGHTLGSIAIYSTHEEFLFVGDSAVGSPYESTEHIFTHPRIPMGRWTSFEEGWKNIYGEVRHLLPLHGKPAFFIEHFDQIRGQIIIPENIMD